MSWLARGFAVGWFTSFWYVSSLLFLSSVDSSTIRYRLSTTDHWLTQPLEERDRVIFLGVVPLARSKIL
jgi:hypothetical protein